MALSIKDETPVGLFNPYIKIARTETDLATGETDTGAHKSVYGTLANEFVLGMGTVDAGFDFYA